MISDDAGMISALGELFEMIDPMPSDLPERIRFSLALRELDTEVARLVTTADELALAARGVEESRTITFDSDSLTIMIRIDPNSDGTVRVDGWLAPPQCRQVEMRMTHSSITETADENGRFVFPAVCRGTAQLIVRQAGGAVDGERLSALPSVGKSVITPALIL
jgi:hypothetical protein